MLAVSDVIQNERFARLYARVLEVNTPTVEELASRSASSQTTVYEDVKHLVEIGVLKRVTDSQPHRYSARRVDINIQTGEEPFRITRTLLVALA
jgi:sugar-specific transcriptional regulator TrmB